MINNDDRNMNNQYSHIRGKDSDKKHSTYLKSESTDKSKIKCYKCYKYEYYKSKCQTNLNKDGERWSNFAKKKKKSHYH